MKFRIKYLRKCFVWIAFLALGSSVSIPPSFSQQLNSCDYRALARIAKQERLAHVNDYVSKGLSLAGAHRIDRIENQVKEIFQKHPNYKKAFELAKEDKIKMLVADEIYRHEKDLLIAQAKNNPEMASYLSLLHEEKLDFLPFEIASRMREIIARRETIKEYVKTQSMLQNKRGLVPYSLKHPEEYLYMVGGLAKTIAIDGPRQAFRDYGEAWKSRETVGGKFYQLLKRLAIAPRSSQTDPVLKEEELKKFNLFTAIADPLIDAPIEITSKARQWTGRTPLTHRISLPLSMGIGIYTWAKILEMQENVYIAIDKKKTLGLQYLEKFRELGLIDFEETLKLIQKYTSVIKRWQNDIYDPSTKGIRYHLPRVVQFVLEGVLHSNEVISFYEVIINAYRESLEKFNAAEAEKKDFDFDSNIKQTIYKKLSSHPVFKDKTEVEMKILTMAFDIPIQLNDPGSMDWYDRITSHIVTGRVKEVMPYYKNEVRLNSDIYWTKLQLVAEENRKSAPEKLDARDKAMLAYRESYLEEIKYNKLPDTSLAATVLMAHASHSIEVSEKFLSKKAAKAKSIANFPPEKIEILSMRLDSPSLLKGAPRDLFNIDASKKQVLQDELDHWSLLVNHPVFLDIAERWKTKQLSDYQAFKEYKARLRYINQVSEMQAAKAKQVGKERALQLSLVESCAFKKDPLTNGQVDFLAYKKMIVEEQISTCLLRDEIDAGLNKEQYSTVGACAGILVEEKFSENAKQECRTAMAKVNIQERACVDAVAGDEKSRNFCEFFITKMEWKRIAKVNELWLQKVPRSEAIIKLSDDTYDEFSKVSKACIDPESRQKFANVIGLDIQELDSLLSCSQ